MSYLLLQNQLPLEDAVLLNSSQSCKHLRHQTSVDSLSNPTTTMAVSLKNEKKVSFSTLARVCPSSSRMMLHMPMSNKDLPETISFLLFWQPHHHRACWLIFCVNLTGTMG